MRKHFANKAISMMFHHRVVAVSLLILCSVVSFGALSRAAGPTEQGRATVDKEWRVYDLVIEDISIINNYRSQFNRVIARSSFEELVRMLKEKQS